MRFVVLLMCLVCSLSAEIICGKDVHKIEPASVVLDSCEGGGFVFKMLGGNCQYYLGMINKPYELLYYMVVVKYDKLGNEIDRRNLMNDGFMFRRDKTKPFIMVFNHDRNEVWIESKEPAWTVLPDCGNNVYSLCEKLIEPPNYSRFITSWDINLNMTRLSYLSPTPSCSIYNDSLHDEFVPLWFEQKFGVSSVQHRTIKFIRNAAQREISFDICGRQSYSSRKLNKILIVRTQYGYKKEF